MALSFVAGQMLNANLWRGTANLGFQTNLLYLDVVNGRIGVNTSTPSVALEVNGNAKVNTITTNAVTSTNSLTLSTASAGNITLTPNTTGLVTIGGTYGIVIPTGNSAQRPTGTPVTGTLRLNTGLDQLEIWDGSAWLTGGSSGGGNVTVYDQQITPDGVANSFTLTYGNGTSTSASLLVSINGVAQLPTTAYSASGNTITFTEIPGTSDIIDIRYLAATVPPGALYNTTGNSAIHVYDTGSITFVTNSANVVSITTAGVVDISAATALKLPVYTVAQAANIATPVAGEVIYVSNGDTGNPCLAVYNGTSWKRVSLGANISAT
jgi:hypothetical protein